MDLCPLPKRDATVFTTLTDAERDAVRAALRDCIAPTLSSVVRFGLRRLAETRGAGQPPRPWYVTPERRRPVDVPQRVGLRVDRDEREWLDTLRLPGEPMAEMLRAALAAWASDVGAEWPRAA